MTEPLLDERNSSMVTEQRVPESKKYFPYLYTHKATMTEPLLNECLASEHECKISADFFLFYFILFFLEHTRTAHHDTKELSL